MSLNQSRAEKSDGQLRKSGGRSGSFGRYAGGGGGGGGKGGGGGAAPPPPHVSSSSSSTVPPNLSTNRSFKKSGNGQGGQSRGKPVSVSSEAATTTAATTRTLQNGAHGQQPSHGPLNTSTASAGKPVDMPIPRNSRALPKAPSAYSAAGSSDSASSTAPAKGDGVKAFPLQFGTINPGLMNGMQIPARTSSAPPNLDEQKRDQARQDSFRAVPTVPIPSAPKPQQQQQKKDLGGSNQSTTGESHPPVQVKRDVHTQISNAPIAPPPKSAAIPGISMPMPFQQAQIPMQFGGPSPQQMPMTLPIGNASQVPQQMFVHNLQSHPLQPQAMIHQGQGVGFAPQISHQMAPQLGNLGIGIAAGQFAQQQQGNFGGPRKTTVKITYPDTHEELRLDKRMDSYTDSGSSGQRPLPNVSSHSQPMPSFNASHYYAQLQPSSYNPSPIFFPTSTPMNTGSQAARFSYPVGQGGQAISFMNASILNPMHAGNSMAPSHGPSESVKFEPALISGPSAPVQGSVKPTAVQFGPRVGGTPVTISMPSSKAEAPKLLKPSGESIVAHQQNNSAVSVESSLQQPKTVPELPGITPLPLSSGHSAAETAVISTQKAQLGASSDISTSAGDVGCVVAANDDRRREPIRRTDSLKDHQKKSSRKDLRPSHQLQQIDASACGVVKKSSSVKICKDDSTEDDKSRELTRNPGKIQASSGADVSISASNHDAEQSVSTEARIGETVEEKPTPAGSGPSEVTLERQAQQDARIGGFNSLELKHKGLPETSTSVLDMVAKNSKDFDSAACNADHTSLETELHKEMSAGKEEEKVEASDCSIMDSSNAKVHPILSITETSEDVQAIVLDEQEASGSNDSVKLIVSDSRGSEMEQVDSLDVERTTGVIDRTASAAKGSTNAEAVDSSGVLSTNVDNDNLSFRHGITNNSEMVCSQDASLAAPCSSHIEIAAVTSETTDKAEEEVIEHPRDGPSPLLSSGPKGKPSLEPSRGKPTAGKKKKRREILSKADAAGTSDLYNAYKGPDEKHKLANTSETGDNSLAADGHNVNADDLNKYSVASEEDGQVKAEVDDWEDAADVSTPNLENGKQVSESNKHHEDDGNEVSGRKKYSRDFLLTFSTQCTNLPAGFNVVADVADVFMSAALGSCHVIDHPSPGKIIDRSPGVSRGDRRMGGGIQDDDKWTKSPGSFALRDLRGDVGHGAAVSFRPGQGVNHGVLRNPRGQPSNQFAGGILSGPAQPITPQGGPVRNNADADRWRSMRGLMPPPQTPLQVMHKAERKYEVGKVSDEEQAKQRRLKAILNKLTPQNFEKLFEQVKEVNIDNTVTLTGVISQIFDKALTEPTFCEMYADFCFHLSSELPDFYENDEKITFKRLLLNKCQEEFERGEREQAEADRVEEEGEIKQSEQQREEKRIKARRRMLGNIRLIGELYKKRMLTERIMHECIQKLLGQYQSPDEEDIEALCKLMSTIGEMIDHHKAKEHMDAYFDMMLKLSTNQKLSSRVRFMLRDAIDLRKNRWQQRRKVDGPKKIEEVHRDAAQERQSQSSRSARGPGINSMARRGPPGDYAPRVSTLLPSPNSQIGGLRGLPSQVRGFGGQDVRFDDRHPLESRTLSLPLPQRPTDDSSITLGPQGGLARGMSMRGQPLIPSVPLPETPSRMVSGPNGYSSIPDRTPYSSREEITPRYMPDRFSEASLGQTNAYAGGRDSKILDQSLDRLPTTSMSAGRTQGSLGCSLSVSSDAKPLSEEVLREKSKSAIREFYSAKDEEEVALCIKELNSRNFYPSMVSLWIMDSFEGKDMERDLLTALLVNLSKSPRNLLSKEELTQGFESVLSSLEDAVNDAPRAAEFLGRICAKFILENVVPFDVIGKLIREGGEEPGRLLEIGLASEVLGSVMEIIRAEKGDSTLKEIRTSSHLRLEDFRPPHPFKSKKLDAFL